MGSCFPLRSSAVDLGRGHHSFPARVARGDILSQVRELRSQSRIRGNNPHACLSPEAAAFLDILLMIAHADEQLGRD